MEQFVDNIYNKLHKTIKLYENLISVYDQDMQINAEARKALNLIETGIDTTSDKTITWYVFIYCLNLVIQLYKYIFENCQQPIKISMIRLFSLVSADHEYHFTS